MSSVRKRPFWKRSVCGLGGDVGGVVSGGGGRGGGWGGGGRDRGECVLGTGSVGEK